MQEIIDSDTEHFLKTIMKFSDLKTHMHDKVNKVKEFNELRIYFFKKKTLQLVTQ